MGILEFIQDLEDYYLAENVLTSGRRIALLFQGIQSRVDLDELKIAIETQERFQHVACGSRCGGFRGPENAG